MSSPVQSPGLEIRHKSQQSHDSGAYIDWNSEDSNGSPILDGSNDGPVPFVASNVTGEFVTVVAVESSSGSPSEPGEVSFTETDGNDSFVTVLSIGETDSKDEMRKLSLSVPGIENEASEIQEGDGERIEDVLVYRLPGERLGFGLKFEGGTKTAEKVRRLFIQSCAPDSPASRAKCSWGALQEGDEVLEIDGVPVQNMTRIDCVRCLKESHVVIKLSIHHPAPNTNPYVSDQIGKRKKLGLKLNDAPHESMNNGDVGSPTKTHSTAPMVISAEMKKSPPPPPPIPPRKLPRKNPPQKDRAASSTTSSIVVPPRGFGDGESLVLNASASSCTSPTSVVVSDNIATDIEVASKSNGNYSNTSVVVKQVLSSSPRGSAATSEQSSPESARSIGRRFIGFNVDAIPPEAEVYLDLLAQEEMNRLNESESDDTGSSISTVVDRLSSVPTTSNSSFSASSTTPSTPTATSTPAIDLAKVLSPFEQLEREFSSGGQVDEDIFSKFSADDTTYTEYNNVLSHEQSTNFSSIKSTPIYDDPLTLQPPISFQDAPLSYGDEKVITTLDRDEMEIDLDSVSMNECKLEAIQDDSLVNVLTVFGEDKIEQENDVPILIAHSKTQTTNVEISPNPRVDMKTIETESVEKLNELLFHEHKTSRDVNGSPGTVSVTAPALPPKPAPRQDSNASALRFRSGKKRPPPPPPPRGDRLVCPQPECPEIYQNQSEVSEKTVENEDIKKEPLVRETSETVNGKNKISLKPPRVTLAGDEDFFPTWEFDVTKRRERREKSTIDDGFIDIQLNTEVFTSGKSFLEIPQSTLLEDDDSEDDVPEFAINAIMGSEAFFPFHWSVVSHLDPIGEDAAEEEEAEEAEKLQKLEEEEEDEDDGEDGEQNGLCEEDGQHGHENGELDDPRKLDAVFTEENTGHECEKPIGIVVEGPDLTTTMISLTTPDAETSATLVTGAEEAPDATPIKSAVVALEVESSASRKETKEIDPESRVEPEPISSTTSPATTETIISVESPLKSAPVPVQNADTEPIATAEEASEVVTNDAPVPSTEEGRMASENSLALCDGDNVSDEVHTLIPGQIQSTDTPVEEANIITTESQSEATSDESEVPPLVESLDQRSVESEIVSTEILNGAEKTATASFPDTSTSSVATETSANDVQASGKIRGDTTMDSNAGDAPSSQYVDKCEEAAEESHICASRSSANVAANMESVEGMPDASPLGEAETGATATATCEQAEPLVAGEIIADLTASAGTGQWLDGEIVEEASSESSDREAKTMEEVAPASTASLASPASTAEPCDDAGNTATNDDAPESKITVNPTGTPALDIVEPCEPVEAPTAVPDDHDIIEEFTPDVQHGSVALTSVPGSDADEASGVLTAAAPCSTASCATGVRGTMDALLALDSLTAPIPSKSPSVHGYSQSSLSDTSLSPPPSFSRLPPDGHEFPPNYQEPNHFSVGVPALIEMEVPLDKSSSLCSGNDPIMPPDLPLSSPPPPLPCSGPPTRKPSIGQEVELAATPSRKLSTSSVSSASEEVAARSPARNLPWRKDEKSERSVRDKIAMFSNAQDGQTSVLPPLRRLSKYSSSEDVFYQDDSMDSTSGSLPSGKVLSRSVLSVDKIGQRSPFSGRHPSDTNFSSASNNLYKKSSPIYNSSSDVSSIASVTSVETASSPKSLDYTTRTQSYMDLPSSSSSAYSSGSPDSSLSSTTSAYTLGYSSTLPRKLNHNRHSTTASSTEGNQKSNVAPSLYRRTSFCGATGTSNLHSRSQSLVDVGAIPSNKRNSIAGYKATSEDMRKASLNALIEQRRRGISKLRGLIIPEKVSETTNQPIIDLPEIKSRDSILSSKPQLLSKDDPKQLFSRHSGSSTNKWGTATCTSLDKPSSGVNSSNTTATTNLSSLPWKSQTQTTNLPKYSPAFKRKSLSVYGVSSSASSVSSSLSSSREELRPLFESATNNVPKSCPPPLPPMKPPRNATNVGSSITKSTLSPNYTSSLLTHPEPPKSLESITSPTRSDLSFEFLSSNSSSPDLRMTSHMRPKDELVQTNSIKTSVGKISNGDLYGKSQKNNGTHLEKGLLPSDVGRSAAEDDSDNDSAVSSSRSSISHGFSPPPSPLPDNASHRSIGDHSSRQHLETIAGNDSDKRPLRRTLSSETTASAASSTASTLTSGSQASCSSNGSSGSDSNKRVLKAQSVEAINRKNVLSSARYSSGRDLKVGSPLIQRKFEDESEDFISSKDNVIVDSQLSRKTENYGGGESKHEIVHKHKIIHSEAESKGGDRIRETVQYRMSSSECLSDGNIKMAYLEVEENEFVGKPSESLSDQLPLNEIDIAKRPMDTGLEEDIDGLSSPARSTVPQPAPRRIIPPMMAMTTGKSTQSNENLLDNEQKSPQKSQSIGTGIPKAENEDVFRLEKSVMKTQGTEFNSPIPFSADSQNGNSGSEVNVESWKINSINTSVTENCAKSKAPVVPPKPKPVQRRSSLRGGSPPEEAASAEPESTSTENLIDILIGRSGKPEHATTRLRERQKSRDSEGPSKSDSQPEEKDPEVEQPVVSGSMKSSAVTTGEQPNPPSSRVPTQTSRNLNCRRSVSVNDIKKAFEKAELALANSGRASNNASHNSTVKTSTNGLPNNHIRVSSLDSTTSEDSMVPPLARYGSASNLHREQYGSITSLASSSTSLISQQELQTLIDEANQSIEESGGFCTPVQEVLVVILHRETMGGSVGITLAGGADYETKEITVHKVLAGSLADRDGRIQKGDRILSINGRSMKNVTHKESLEILKAPRHEVVLVVSRPRSDISGAAPEEVYTTSMRTSLSSSSRPPRILEQLTEAITDSATEDFQDDVVRGPPITIVLKKDGAGLGFSLEGGKDSPTGDKPLTIKKIFTGGAAEKHGQLSAGDELLVMNGKDLTVMSRIEAWSLMKRLPDGNVTLTVRCKINKKQ